VSWSNPEDGELGGVLKVAEVPPCEHGQAKVVAKLVAKVAVQRDKGVQEYDEAWV